jgi:meiotic recombination protein SPO11
MDYRTTHFSADLGPSEVLGRIEQCASWFVQQFADGKLPQFYIPCPHDEKKSHVLSLVGSQGDSADRLARLCAVLELCHETLSNNKTITQRSMYYRLRATASEVFSSTRHLQDAIRNASLLLQISRRCLGITCSSKGLVAGPLLLVVSENSDGEQKEQYEESDTSTHHSNSEKNAMVYPIPGDLAEVESMSFHLRMPSSSVLAILVVEKDAVFQGLLKEDAQLTSNVIIVTAKGMPDLATRAFLHKLHTQYPEIPVLGLVDWNPAGVNILYIYKYGSENNQPESCKYGLTSLKWLGLRTDMIRNVSGEVLQSITNRDAGLIRSLKARLSTKQGVTGSTASLGWVSELEEMETSGVKADIEAFYDVKNENEINHPPKKSRRMALGDVIRTRILECDYV